jgi:hypothetical protein
MKVERGLRPVVRSKEPVTEALPSLAPYSLGCGKILSLGKYLSCKVIPALVAP